MQYRVKFGGYWTAECDVEAESEFAARLTAKQKFKDGDVILKTTAAFTEDVERATPAGWSSPKRFLTNK